MKKLLKKIGKFFIALNQIYENDLYRTVLLVDGSFILPNNFALIIQSVKKKFINAKLTVITFQDKREFIKDNFPDAEVIIPENRLRTNKHQLPIQLFFLLRRRFNFIVLSSLDISLVALSLLFSRSKIFLHNRWMEWYRLRYRTLSDVLIGNKSVDVNRRRTIRDLKEIIKLMGRIFIILPALDEKDISSRVLIEDNGYTETGHIINAVRNAQELFINPDITILTSETRKEDFINKFPQVKLVTVAASRNKYKLAIEMYKLRRYRFNYVILTTLDISPIVVSFLFMKAKVLLYNRWHQWWSLSCRNLFGYSKEITMYLVMIPMFIYLLVTSSFIILRTNFRLKLIK